MTKFFCLLLLGATVFSAHALTKNEAALIQAAEKGDLDKIKKVLKAFDKKKDNIDAYQSQQRVSGEEGIMIIPPGLSALQEAVKRGHLEAVKALLAAGAAPNDRCTLGYAEKDEIAEALLKAEATGIPCSAVTTDLILNNKIKLLARLLEQGLDVNAANTENAYSGDSPSPIAFAAEHGKVEIVELLIRHKADVNASNTYGTPLAKATEQLDFFRNGDGKTWQDAKSRLKAYEQIIRLLKAAGAK